MLQCLQRALMLTCFSAIKTQYVYLFTIKARLLFIIWHLNKQALWNCCYCFCFILFFWTNCLSIGTDPVWINMLDITSKVCIVTMFVIVDLKNSVSYVLCRYCMICLHFKVYLHASLASSVSYYCLNWNVKKNFS